MSSDVRVLMHAVLASTCIYACSGDAAGAPTPTSHTATTAATSTSTSTSTPTTTSSTPTPSAGSGSLTARQSPTSSAGTGVSAIMSVTPAAGAAGGSAATMASSTGTVAGNGAAAGGAAATDGGSAGSTGAGTAAAVSGTSGAAATAGSAAMSMMNRGVLPPISDPTQKGPFEITEEDNVGPMQQYTTIAPKALGKGGIKHPILIWGPGAGASPAIYQTLLNHIASHGFVIVSYNSTPQGPELTTGLDWIIAESKRQDSTYYDKVDTTNVAMGGQSAGSLATFAAAHDERLTTTLHINGGTFNHDDVNNLIKPAFFVCGDDPSVTGGDGTWESDMARPNCDADFKNAMVPVWYGVVIGSSHTTVIDQGDTEISKLKAQYLGSTVAWLRWQIADDQELKKMFVGPDCGYCKEPSVWLVQQKDLQ